MMDTHDTVYTTYMKLYKKTIHVKTLEIGESEGAQENTNGSRDECVKPVNVDLKRDTVEWRERREKAPSGE